MKTTIYYYTGTGNSLWTARTSRGRSGTRSSSRCTLRRGERVKADGDAVGLVFPVHMWGVPSLALEFLGKLEKDPSRYYFAVAVNAGQVSRTLVQLRNLMRAERSYPLRGLRRRAPEQLHSLGRARAG